MHKYAILHSILKTFPFVAQIDNIKFGDIVSYQMEINLSL